VTRPARIPIGPLFESVTGHAPPRARTSDPLSSHAAADKMEKSGKLNRQCTEVLVLLCQYPGLTSRKLGEIEGTGLDRYDTGRRLPDLKKKGFARSTDAEDCNELRWWPTPNGLDWYRRHKQ